MKTCKLCGHPIESWQSLQLAGNDFAHTACLLGETPRPKPITRLKPNERITFTPEESYRNRHIPTHPSDDLIDSEGDSS